MLPRNKAKRGIRKSRKTGFSNIPERTSIHDRPEIQVFGHWEGDLMCFRKNSQHMLVCLEKKSRFVMARQLLNKTAKLTSDALLSLFKRLTKTARLSMTFDNGGEFAGHKICREKLKMDTFFCDPYASWQKGAVENANGFLRRMLPRKTSFKDIKRKEFENMILRHNTKPRKCLGWKTPLQVFNENLQSVALHT